MQYNKSILYLTVCAGYTPSLAATHCSPIRVNLSYPVIFLLFFHTFVVAHECVNCCSYF